MTKTFKIEIENALEEMELVVALRDRRDRLAEHYPGSDAGLRAIENVLVQVSDANAYDALDVEVDQE